MPSDDMIFFDENGKEVLPFSLVLAVSISPIIILLIYWCWIERNLSFRT